MIKMLKTQMTIAKKTKANRRYENGNETLKKYTQGRS